MATQIEVIKNFMKSLDKSNKTGEAALDAAMAGAHSPFKTFQNSAKTNIKSAFINDLKESKNIKYFLKVYCGIDFDTEDSGAITGSDAGGSQVKTDADIILESGNLNSTFQSDSFSVEGLEVELADNKTFSSLGTTEKFIWRGLYTWWVKGALDLIAESFGTNFGFGKAASPTTNKLYVKFINSTKSDNVSVSNSYNETTGATNGLTMTINIAHYKSLEKDTDKANTEFDRTIAHEMTHAVMLANMLYLPTYRSLPGFVTEGLAELAIGITNSNAEKIQTLAADTTKFDIGLDANNLARDESFMYEGGYIFFRYMARQLGDLTLANSDTANTLMLTFYGDDTITNLANNVTINSGGGNDSIKAGGNKLNIISDSGNNNIYINENSKNNNISLGSGKDSVYISSNTSNNTVSTGKGNDSVYSGSKVALIDTSTGNDYVYLHLDSKKNTVNAGVGNDTVHSGAQNNLINGEDGNDYVYLNSTARKNTVNGGKGNDYIYIYANSQNHTINGGTGNDIVHSEGTNILVNTGEGNDVVQLYSSDSTAQKNTINSGKGDDSIYSGGASISVNAGEGKDYIHVYSYANDVTIKPGAGNDTIESYCDSGFLYQYAKGDGNDSVKGFSENDTLSITGSSYSTTTSGLDIIVNVGSSKITLDGAAALPSWTIGTLKGGNSTTTTITVTNETRSPITVGSAVKVINASSRTTAVKITGNAIANTIRGGSGKDSLYGGAGADRLIGNAGADKLFGGAGKDTLNGGAGNDTFTGGAGNDLFICGSGKDVITDYTAGDRISLTSAITKKASLSGTDVILTMGSNSLKIKGARGKNLSINTVAGKSLSTVIGDLISTRLVTNTTKSPVTVGASVGIINATSRTKAVKITGNKLDNTIRGGSGKDSLYGGAGDDSIMGNAGADKLFGGAGADTLRGGAGNDTFTGGAGNDLFICGSGKDVIADYTAGDRISLTSAITKKASLSGSDVILTMGNNSLNVKNAKGKTLKITTAAGKSLSTMVGSLTSTRLITNSTKSPVTVGSSVGEINASSRTTAVKITGNARNNTIRGGSGKDSLYGGAGDDSILGNAGADKLYGEVGEDTLHGGAGNDSLWGGKDNDSLFGGAGNDKLFGDAGNDTLSGGVGNDTLTGGAGNNLFIFSEGKDVITDYTMNDNISIGFVAKTELKASDVVFTTASGDILTVKNGKGKTLNLINYSEDNYTVKITGNSSRNIITGSAGKDTILGSDINDSILGNAGADIILGNEGDDTLIGGKGNDSLWGGDGADTFIYSSGDGKDVIDFFENDDMLKITGNFSTSYDKKAKEIYFKVGTTSKAITLTEFTATSFNINGSDYKISGSTLKKK